MDYLIRYCAHHTSDPLQTNYIAQNVNTQQLIKCILSLGNYCGHQYT